MTPRLRPASWARCRASGTPGKGAATSQAGRLRPLAQGAGLPLTLLGVAREAGLALGVITRNSHRGVSAVLDRHPLPLSVIVTRDDLAEVKPHPRHVLVALEQLGCPPEHALLVGDHPTDLQCAQAAGVRGAAVLTTGGDPEAFRALGAEAIYPDAATLLRDLLEAPGHGCA